MNRALIVKNRDFLMSPKRALNAVVSFAVLVSSANAFAYNCTIKEGRYGYNVIATVKKGLVYVGQYSTTILGRFDYDQKTIYEGRYGYQVFGRRDDDLLYEGRYGYKVLGRFENCDESDFEP